MLDSRIAYDDFGGGGPQGIQPEGGKGGIFRALVQKLLAQKLAGGQADPGVVSPKFPGGRPRPEFDMPRITPGGNPFLERGGFTGGFIAPRIPLPTDGSPVLMGPDGPVTPTQGGDIQPAPVPEPRPDEQPWQPRPARVPRPMLRNRRFGGPSSMEY